MGRPNIVSMAIFWPIYDSTQSPTRISGDSVGAPKAEFKILVLKKKIKFLYLIDFTED